NTADAPVTPPAAEPSAPSIVKEEGPMPTGDTVIASAGEHRVTVADFEKSARISLLFGPEGLTEMPPDRLAIPHIHITMSQALLGQKLMLEEAEKRKLLPTETEIVAWLAAN